MIRLQRGKILIKLFLSEQRDHAARRSVHEAERIKADMLVEDMRGHKDVVEDVAVRCDLHFREGVILTNLFLSEHDQQFLEATAAVTTTTVNDRKRDYASLAVAKAT